MRFERLPGNLRRVNDQLKHSFGIDTESSQVMWRVAWSDDQREKRLSKYTPAGIELLFPEVQELPKYPWIRGRWILENLVNIPINDQAEIPEFKKSYEVIYAFPTKDGMSIEPSFPACKFLVDSVLAAKGKASLGPKYIDPFAGLKSDELKAKKKAEIDALVEELFGDESMLMGRTITGEAVAYTGPSRIELPEFNVRKG